QVAMDDEILMSVRNGRANFAKNFEAVRDRKPLMFAVIVQPFALDVFHDEIREAVGRDGAAIKPRDVRMIEPGENSFFLFELAQKTGATEDAFDELDRDGAT